MRSPSDLNITYFHVFLFQQFFFVFLFVFFSPKVDFFPFLVIDSPGTIFVKVAKGDFFFKKEKFWWLYEVEVGILGSVL